MFCPNCGVRNDDDKPECCKCGYPLNGPETGEYRRWKAIDAGRNHWPFYGSSSLAFSLASLACSLLSLVFFKCFPDAFSYTTSSLSNTVHSTVFLGRILSLAALLMLLIEVVRYCLPGQTEKFNGRVLAIATPLCLAAVILSSMASSLGSAFDLYALNSHVARVRGDVARVRGDLRSMTMAVESYQIDHHAVPAWSLDLNNNAYGGIEKMSAKEREKLRKIPTFRLQHATALATLTTPVSYLPAYFADPFAPVKGATFGYWTNAEKGAAATGYILWSPGPDGNYDLTLENIAKLYDPRKTVPSPGLVERTYDPSNGTESRGDVYRVKQ